MFNINDSIINDDLDSLAEIFNQVEDKTEKLEEGENRIVSILFLDIKGFTAMSEKLKPEEVKRTMDKVLTVFTNSILKFGGYIDKYEGDLIMALFGSKNASETDTERAISAGLKILADLKQINKILSTDLAVRIGINTGEVTTGKIGMKREGDFTVYGDAVNLASRMESNAPINSIMIPLETKEMVDDFFDFNDLGTISVKGKENPVSVWQVKGFSSKKTERWERNSFVVNRSKYVGRDLELSKAHMLYQKSKMVIGTVDEQYKPFVLGIRGSAGLGKSRLVKEFISANNQEKIHLYGYTKSFAQPAYYLFTTMLKRYFMIDDSDSKEVAKEKFEKSYQLLIDKTKTKENLIAARNIVAYLFSIKYDDIRLKNIKEVKPKDLQIMIIMSIRHTLEAIAQLVNEQYNEPLLIYLDDCQWMDESSVALFKTLLIAMNAEEKKNRKKNQNLFFILTYRPDFEIFPEFKYNVHFEEIELKPLTSDNTQELIDALLGEHNLPVDFTHMVQNRSGGNPFFVEELLNYLIEQGDIIVKGDKVILIKQTQNLQIPLSLRNIILSRIDRLNDDSKTILQRASIIGHRFLKSVLSRVNKKLEEHKELEKSFNKLEDDMWFFNENEDDYLFKHILTTEVCYNTILSYNRKIIHRLIAESIEELFKDDLTEHYLELANHYEKAKITEKALVYLKKAGKEAKNIYQNSKALDLFERYLKLTEQCNVDRLQYIEVLRDKGNILRFTGKWDEAKNVYLHCIKLAKEANDLMLLAECRCDLGALLVSRGKYNEGMTIFKLVKEVAEKSKSEQLLARTLGGMGIIYRNQGNYTKAMNCYEEEKKITLKFGNKHCYSVVVGNIGNVYSFQGDYSKAMEYYKENKKIALELGDKHDYSVAVGNMGNVYKNQGDLIKARECYEELKQISLELGDKFGYSVAVGNMGTVYTEQGDNDNAIKCYEEKRQISLELGDRQGYSVAVGNMGIVYYNQGNYNKAMEYLKEYKQISLELGNKRAYSIVVSNMGIVYFEQGNYVNAMECYEEVICICKELKNKFDLCFNLFNKANLHFIMNEYEKAKLFNNEASQIAEEIKRKDVIFSSTVLQHKLHSLEKPEEAVAKLSEMLESVSEEEDKAKLHYEIFKINNSDNHRQKALDLYHKLYVRNHDFDYKKRIDELENKKA